MEEGYSAGGGKPRLVGTLLLSRGESQCHKERPFVTKSVLCINCGYREQVFEKS